MPSATAATLDPSVSASGATSTNKLANAGYEALTQLKDRYSRALAERGVGTHYGDHSSFARMNYSERLEALKEMTKPGKTPPLPSELKQTSCIGWALETVIAAYEKAGRGPRGREISAIVTGAYVDPQGRVHRDLSALGGVLMRELQKDGWTSLFWATDSKNPDSPGSSDRETHRGYIRQAVGQKRYWVAYPYETMKVDDYVMDYNLSEDSAGRAANTAAIDKLRKIPFAVGVAKGGMHCFAMHHGKVSENHWSAGPDSDINSIFEETDLKDWGWSSGLIMVPPGTWQR